MAMSIRLAHERDIGHLAEIERAAGEAFRGIGMPEIADDDPLPDDVLKHGVSAGLLWVAGDDELGSLPVAYLLAEALGQRVHIEQVTVHPDHARQGIGARLIDTCESWAMARGYTMLTLTTFRDVPWNAPYYRRLGFVDVPRDQYPEELGGIVQREHEAGLYRWPRVTMRRVHPREASL